VSPSAGSIGDGPAIRVERLDHHVGGGERRTVVLDGVSLSVARGESVALVGRSGSGKSTLLNLVAGLEPVQHGTVEVFGTPLESLDDRARTLLRRERIGFVHQAFNLVPTLSVADNVTLPLALAGIGAAERRERLGPLLEAVGLATRGDDWPDRLSGGEQQRVAIARALIHRPPLILADEPTGNLDAASGRAALALLDELVQDHGAALLLVTHSLEVAAVTDRALTLVEHALQPIDATRPGAGSAW